MSTQIAYNNLIVFGAISIDMIPQTITSDIWVILVFKEGSISPMFLFYQLVFMRYSHCTSKQIVTCTN